jgi:hypothetical protein
MARDRDTYIHRLGLTPETASVVSAKNKIYAIPADTADSVAFQIGVIANFNPSESRTIEPVRGIGFGDHVAELVPGATEPLTISITRTAQYLSMIYQVFGYKGGVDGIVRSLRHHKWPFDVIQEVVISRLPSVQGDLSGDMAGLTIDGLNGELDAIVTYYEGCWMSDYGVTYTSDAALVQEDVTVNVTDIIASTSSDYPDGDSYDANYFNPQAKSRIVQDIYDDLGRGVQNTQDTSGQTTE